MMLTTSLPLVVAILCSSATTGALAARGYCNLTTRAAADEQTKTTNVSFVELSIKATKVQHRISRYIYGINNIKSSVIDAEFAKEIDLPLIRWGGEDKQRYNWKTLTMNGVQDWYYETYKADAGDADKFIEANNKHHTDMVWTVPMLGWIAKPLPANANQTLCQFSISKYNYTPITPLWSSNPPQDTGHPDCGSGVIGTNSTSGTNIYLSNNDPSDGCFAVDSSWSKEWLQHLVAKFGGAKKSSPKFYALDNEPDIWHNVNGDARKTAIDYDELVAKGLEYAAVIKAADPHALVTGPVITDYRSWFNSPIDYVNQNGKPDRLAHGNQPFLAYYLQQMKKAEQKAGKRLLDVLDVHYYEQASGIQSEDGGSDDLQALRIRSTRSLWDPTYATESWYIYATYWTDNGTNVTLIPRLKAIAAENYPGTKVALTEYNWGGRLHISGAIAQAEALGLFGKLDVFMAAYWDIPWAPSVPIQLSALGHAYRMYLNYDCSGGKFGEYSLTATSNDTYRVSVYASAHSKHGKGITLVVLNKNTTDVQATIAVDGLEKQGAVTGKVFRYTQANLSAIVRESDVKFVNGKASLYLPAYSITTIKLNNKKAEKCDSSSSSSEDE